MANKLKNGSNCAACVPYPETGADSWILTKVDKKLPGNKYLVRDEYADDPNYETYTVDSSHITPFPSTLNEEYKNGETVLALWHDEETNEWSTMFYNAEVSNNKTNDPRTVKLLYSGTDFEVEVEKDKIARLPPNFTFTEVDEKEDKTSTTATEEPSEDNSAKNGKKGRHTKDESNASDSASPSQTTSNVSNADDATTNTEIISDSTEEKSNILKSKDESVLNAASETKPISVKSENPSEAITSNTVNPEGSSARGEANSIDIKSNDIPASNQENATSIISNESENAQQNLIQAQSSDSVKSDDQTSDKGKRSKSTSKDNTSATSPESSATASSKLHTPEDRRVYFMFHKPEYAEKPQFKCLTNEDFTELAGPVKELNRMHTEEGTPLLDSLEDKELFNQENLLHVTGSGVISVANVEEGNEKSGLAEGKVPCGRLRKIINEWTKNPMDSI